MSSCFFDSSALVKRYRSEDGTTEVDRILREPDAGYFIARLAVVEVQRALARTVRDGEISAQEFDALRDRLYQDLGHRRLRIVRLREFHFHSAVRLIRKYAPPQHTPLLRSLDTIHLAAALDVHQRSNLDHFVSADKDLCAVAKAENLSVINPVSLSA